MKFVYFFVYFSMLQRFWHEEPLKVFKQGSYVIISEYWSGDCAPRREDELKDRKTGEHYSSNGNQWWQGPN